MNTVAVGTADNAIEERADGAPGNALAYTLQQPGEFVVGAGASNDWYVAGTTTADTRNDLLWGNGTPEKTIFDPCPAGWKVAPNGTWNDFTAAGSGANAPSAEAYGQNSPFPFYFNGTKQTANGVPARVDSGKNGRYYTPQIGNVQPWFPAAGYLQFGLTSIGEAGLNWTSTEESTHSRTLFFTIGGIMPTYSSTRSLGFPVRCLQE
jgi:hypothetical protein